MKKGTKWRGREPMKTDLIERPRKFKMCVLCVHLR